MGPWRVARAAFWIAMAVAGCRSSPEPTSAATRPAPPPGATSPTIPESAIFYDLDLRFGTVGAALPVFPHGTPRERLQAFVADRMQRDSFYSALAPSFTRSASEAGWPAIPHTLRHDDTDDYYYLTAPCAATERVAVTPWWDTTAKVQVCRDDYRPTVLSYKKPAGETTWCEGTHQPFFLDPSSPCRCGEYLVNCAASDQMQHDLLDAFDEEQTKTFQHIVQSHLPINALLTTADTVRSDLADFYYARAEYFRTGTFAYAPPKPDSAHLRPRPEHFTAGLITTHNWLGSDDGVRVRAAALLQVSLCNHLGSAKVEPDAMFAAIHGKPAATFRQAVRMELTTQKGCDTCHKSLENIALAMQSYPIAQFGSRYVEQQPSTAGLYIDGELRGEGPATVVELANEIVAQPEFTACVVDTTLEYLFDGQQPPPVARQHIVDRFAHSQDFAGMFTEAVLVRYLPEDAR